MDEEDDFSDSESVGAFTGGIRDMASGNIAGGAGGSSGGGAEGDGEGDGQGSSFLETGGDGPADQSNGDLSMSGAEGAGEEAEATGAGMRQFPGGSAAEGGAAANKGEGPHVRRKSSIPTDPTVLSELASHKGQGLEGGAAR